MVRFHYCPPFNTVNNKQLGGCHVTAKRRSTKRKEFIENWDLYLNFPKIFECHPGFLPPNDPNGEDGQFSFICLENGILIPTREWDLVKRVQEGKMSVNLQMKMWAETLWDSQLRCPLMMLPELKEYCIGMPDWVFRGTIEQAKSRVMKDIGFIPTWMKSEDRIL